MPDPADPSDTIAILKRWSGGDGAALADLTTMLYQELHRIAVRQVRGERNLTIRPTALVHEVYLRLASMSEIGVRDRAHFLALAARVMRQALVDEARRLRADKRQGGTPVTLSDTNLGGSDSSYDALDVDALLTELAGFDESIAEIVLLRVFGGLSVQEAAEVLNLSVATVNRRWATGKTWMVRELASRA